MDFAIGLDRWLVRSHELIITKKNNIKKDVERKSNNSFIIDSPYTPDKAQDKVKTEQTPRKLIMCLLFNLLGLLCNNWRYKIE